MRKLAKSLVAHDEIAPMVTRVRHQLDALDLTIYAAVRIVDIVSGLMSTAYQIGREDQAKSIARKKAVKRPLQKRLLPAART